MKRPCTTKYCRNKVIPSRDGRFCSTCRSKKQKRKNPFLYYYDKQRHNARRRGKPFLLCLEQFMLIWLSEPKKWKEKISGPDDCTWEMDRINEEEGYHFDNIQLITKRKNVQKYHDYKGNMVIDARWEPKQSPNTSEAPF